MRKVNGIWSKVGKAALCALLYIAFQLAPFTLQAQSDLYERYSGQEGVMVAFVSRFPLDSVSRIDVTVVEATTEEGWAWMRREFLIADLMPEQQADLREGSDVVLFARRNRNNPREGAPVVGAAMTNAQITASGVR